MPPPFVVRRGQPEAGMFSARALFLPSPPTFRVHCHTGTERLAIDWNSADLRARIPYHGIVLPLKNVVNGQSEKGQEAIPPGVAWP